MSNSCIEHHRDELHHLVHYSEAVGGEAACHMYGNGNDCARKATKQLVGDNLRRAAKKINGL